MSRPEPAAPTAPDTPPFAEPWQAEVFAMTVALHERGLFAWSEWARYLSAAVHAEDAASDGGDYYHRWLVALEALLADKGLAPGAEVDRVAEAWQRAAHATPHGAPILLENDPLRAG